MHLIDVGDVDEREERNKTDIAEKKQQKIGNKKQTEKKESLRSEGNDFGVSVTAVRMMIAPQSIIVKAALFIP